MNNTLEPADELACRTLVHDFAQSVDDQQYERLRDLFTADAVFARPADPDTLLRGIDSIVAAFAARPKNRLTFHLLTNVSIKAEAADSASGVCRILLFSGDAADGEVPGKGRKAASSQLIGFYTDRYVRTPGGWRPACSSASPARPSGTR